jgi:urease accessory protein UreF
MSLSENSAQPTLAAPEFARSRAANLPGEWRAMLRRIGSPALSDFASDSNFLETYLSELLIPVELPAIAEACGHAMRGELRELIDQDHHLSPKIGAFAEASRQTGRLQLSRLRPLRENRLVQRYLSAVEFGQANGWHTVVYGMTLALYSLPLRQGLLHYAQVTLGSLAKNAVQSDDAVGPDELMQQVPNAVEAALARC